MPVLFADYDPGMLTGIYVLIFGGLGVAFFLVLAGVMAWFKERRVARGFLFAAGGVFGLAIVLVLVVTAFGKPLHLL